MMSLINALRGKLPVDSPQYMDGRDRIDFALIYMVFGVYVPQHYRDHPTYYLI